MDPQFDITKLVGAASAPVALIIASSIFLSNVTGKYGLLANIFLNLTKERRDPEKADFNRNNEVSEELAGYAVRLRILIMATTCLGISVLSFILTVALTSVCILLPKSNLFPILTVAFSLLGALTLAVSVVMEMVENLRARSSIQIETRRLL